MRSARVMLAVTRPGPPDTRDAAAFDVLYRQYGGRVFAFLCHLISGRDLADDLYQETWLRVARGWRALPAAADVEAWLFTIARNVFISRYRARQVERRGLQGLRQLEVATPARPDRLLEAAQGLGALEAAFAALDEDDRTILWLAAIEEMDQARIADIMGVGYAALRQRLTRARIRLAQHLGASGDGAAGQRRRPGRRA
jgi:RNA polymerase sigma-70 factor, ECF subfamily